MLRIRTDGSSVGAAAAGTDLTASAPTSHRRTGDASRHQVSYEDGQLTIIAENSKLGEILAAVSERLAQTSNSQRVLPTNGSGSGLDRVRRAEYWPPFWADGPRLRYPGV